MVAGGIGQIRGAVIAAFGLGLLQATFEYSTTASSAKSWCLWWSSYPADPTTGSSASGPGAWHDGVGRQAPRQVSPKFTGQRGVLLGFVLGALVLLVAPAVLSDFRLSLLGRFVCFAIVVVGIGLAWGRGGMLTLGQGVFFGLGGYVMAMHLKLADAGPSGVPLQTASEFEELTVLQNLDIAAGADRSPLALLRRRSSVPPEVEQAMDAVGLTGLRDRPAGELAHGQKQWLEIAMLLVQNARVLLLDEPWPE